MTDDTAFLEQIAENPDELGPRLRYADFLDDRRDAASAARAEFIRVQCALHHLPAADQSLQNLAERERALLEANWHVWMRPICQALGESLPVPPLKRTWSEWVRRRFRGAEHREAQRWELIWTGGSNTSRHLIAPSLAVRRQNHGFLSHARFARGFVDQAALTARASRGPTYLDRLFERTPLTSLKLTDFDRMDMRHLVRKGWLSRLRKLDLSLSAPDILLELIDASAAAAIRSFELYTHSYVYNLAGLVLAESTALQPREIGLHRVEVPSDAQLAFVLSPFMARVETLLLEGDFLSVQALEALLEHAPLRRLELVGLRAASFAEHVGARLNSRFPDLLLSARVHPLD